MYNIKTSNIFKNWNTLCYIAKKLEPIRDDFGNQITIYDKPKPYKFNIQPISGESEAKEFGELTKNMRVALITERDKYINEFHNFDLVYLDGVTPKGETFNGERANYRIYDIRPQNVALKIYFLRVGKSNKEVV